MSDATDPTSLDRWIPLVRSPPFQEALIGGDAGLVGLDSTLRAAAAAATSPDPKYLAELLATVASYWPQPDDFQDPYGPFASLVGRGRSAIPADLNAEDLSVLAAVVSEIPNLVFRSRVLDVLALRGDPSLRSERHRLQVQALVDHGIEAESLVHDREQWERGILVAVRFGRGIKTERELLVQMLVDGLMTEDDDHLVLIAANMLRTHQLARVHAASIAGRLVAANNAPNALAKQTVLEEAAKWYELGGDPGAAAGARFEVVRGQIAEADAAILQGGRGGLLATSLLERALQTLRALPRSERVRLGAETLADELVHRIRGAGTQALGEMHSFEVSSGDISGHVDEAVLRVAGLEPLEALHALAALNRFAVFDGFEARARAAASSSPILSLVTVRHLGADGRTAHVSSPGELFYGLPGDVWREMVREYEFRIGLLGSTLIPRVWLALNNEHNMRLEHFWQVTHNSPMIPPDHEELFAQGLLLGYRGEFAAAEHLLVPQIEALVRYHLANAGERTTVIESDGRQNEIGLTALMQRDAANEIFGADISFEMRALLCGPLGPNLRNEVAHGLVNDNGSMSSTSVYLWWLAHKLAFVPFWNARHKTAGTQDGTFEDPGSAPDPGDQR